MRGLPAMRFTCLTSVIGWNIRPCWTKRGTQSVISIAPPVSSKSRVTSTAVLVR